MLCYRQTRHITNVVNDAVVMATRYMVTTYNVAFEQKRSDGLLYRVRKD